MTEDQRQQYTHDLHKRWEEEPPSITELLHAPVWALRPQDIDRIYDNIGE